ncbi:hypothetical protein DP106_00890 [Halonotius pteroides]|uniref:Uncharacterized protein n=1 Tax=Halonotius pteroides TaxID=268735 RepID=A0A3A6QSL7_9EURY|nr:hypothetical protein DP106_00890 [Halonotius pteroides]
MNNLGDYLEEINTALATQGEEFYYESLDDVISALENESEEYHEQAKQRATTGLGISGAGVAGKLAPEFYSQISEQVDTITQSNLATVGLVGALGVSTLPAYLTKRSLDERDEIDQMIEDLEEGNYSEGDTDFAYDVAEKLA